LLFTAGLCLIQPAKVRRAANVVSQNVTLDGVVEDPSGEGGFRHGGWFVQFMGQDWQAWAELELAEAQGADALLTRRRAHKSRVTGDCHARICGSR
jgi:hypothetical protein